MNKAHPDSYVEKTRQRLEFVLGLWLGTRDDMLQCAKFVEEAEVNKYPQEVYETAKDSLEEAVTNFMKLEKALFGAEEDYIKACMEAKTERSILSGIFDLFNFGRGK